MVATESNKEKVMATLRGLLAAIVGDGGTTAWYTPNLVARVPALEDVKLDQSLDYIYLMVPDRAPEERANTCRMGVELTFDLVLAARFPESGDAWADGEERARIQNRLAQDATNVLMNISTVNALQLAGVDASEILVGSDIGAPEETYVEGWAVAFLGITVRYRYLAGAFGVAS
jgi:hypothetical protein